MRDNHISDFQPAPRLRPRPHVLPQLEFEPKEWRVLDDFDWSREIVVEVGSGTGEWGLQEAQKNPKKIFIAVERTQARSRKLMRAATELRLPNHLAIRADAVVLVAQKFPKHSVDRFVFFYPNPTPKKRQANQRFFVSSAFAVFHDALKASGSILLASNIRAYVEEARYFLENFWSYKTGYFGPARFTEPRTAFERKYAQGRKSLWELEVSHS